MCAISWPSCGPIPAARTGRALRRPRSPRPRPASRRSHFDAVATQRLMSRRPDLRVAGFADVQLVTLAFQDEQRTREFVARTLGKLADADRGRRHAVRVRRRAVQRCRAPVHQPQHGPQPPPAPNGCFPLQLVGHGLEACVAPEIAQWLGTHPAAPPTPGDADVIGSCGCGRFGWSYGPLRCSGPALGAWAAVAASRPFAARPARRSSVPSASKTTPPAAMPMPAPPRMSRG